MANFQQNWHDCDPYGLRRLVYHIKACLDLEQDVRSRNEQLEAIFSVVLDEGFQQAQWDKIGDDGFNVLIYRTNDSISQSMPALVLLGLLPDRLPRRGPKFSRIIISQVDVPASNISRHVIISITHETT